MVVSGTAEEGRGRLVGGTVDSAQCPEQEKTFWLLPILVMEALLSRHSIRQVEDTIG